MWCTVGWWCNWLFLRYCIVMKGKWIKFLVELLRLIAAAISGGATASLMMWLSTWLVFSIGNYVLGVADSKAFELCHFFMMFTRGLWACPHPPAFALMFWYYRYGDCRPPYPLHRLALSRCAADRPWLRWQKWTFLAKYPTLVLPKLFGITNYFSYLCR